MKTVCTIEARMTSSRLPGKVLLEVLGQPMLAHMVRRLKSVPQIDEIVIATTVNSTDDPIVALASRLGVKAYRGSENDVSLRVIEAAESCGATTIVQTTGDCPLIDPYLVEQVILLYQNNACDVACNTKVRCFPDGMDVVVFSVEQLKKSYSLSAELRHREHVSLHFFENQDLFKFCHLPAARNVRFPDLGLTLDERADFELIKKIIEYFVDKKPLFTCLDIVELLERNPEWKSVNSAVIRKSVR